MTNIKRNTNIRELLTLNNNTRNLFTVCKHMSSVSFKSNVSNKLFAYK